MPGKPAPLAERFWRNVIKQPGQACWLWRSARSRPHNYGSISIQSGTGQHRNVGAHRLSWEMHYGPIPAGMFVCHLCDNPPCVRPDHLMLGTLLANFNDARLKGRIPIVRGEQQGQSKITAADVATIVALRGTMSQRTIGALYGLTQSSIKDIQLCKRWKHIERPQMQPKTPSEAAAKLTPAQRSRLSVPCTGKPHRASLRGSLGSVGGN